MNAPAPALSFPPSGPPRVLLVENDPAMEFLLTQALSAHYAVAAARDGFEAWQDVLRHPPALVIIGPHISGSDKLALTRSLRVGTGAAVFPIVLLNANPNRDLLLRCLDAGASNFLLSPFSMAELLACVRLELNLHAPPPTPA